MFWGNIGKSLSWIFLGLGFVHCGAPNKSAGDVQGLFNTSSDLQSKGTRICDALRIRSESPRVADVGGNIDCGNAGLAAVDLSKNTDLYIMNADALKLDDKDQGKDKDGFTVIPVRMQMWLNRSLLGVASILGKKLAENKDFSGGEVKIKAPPGAPDFSGLFPTRFDIKEKPNIDVTTFTFKTRVAIEVGNKDDLFVRNEIVAAGTMIDNNIAVTIKTTEPKPFKESLLHHFSGVILVIPHASDVYVDVSMEMGINKGTGLDGTIKTMLPKILGSALKPTIYSFLSP